MSKKITTGALALVLGAALLSDTAHAARKRREQVETVDLALGSSRILTMNRGFAIKEIVLGNPTAVDVKAVTSSQIVVSAKGIGESNITFYGVDGSTQQFLVLTRHPTSALEDVLKLAFPNDDIQVFGAGGAVFLTGFVEHAGAAESASRIAENLYAASAFQPPTVVNLLEVAGSQQVQLKLKLVEVKRNGLSQMGMRAWFQDRNQQLSITPGGVDPGAVVQPNATGRGIQNLQKPTRLDESNAATTLGLPIITAPIAGSFGILFSNTAGTLPISAALSVLQRRGVARSLQEPTLVAMSGKKANFRVGGEFPIPLSGTLGVQSVEFKDFGVQLEFVPTVMAEESIQIGLNANVSERDDLNRVGVFPAVTKRESSTTVRLRNGQSFAIAGLLQDSLNNSVDKVPLLGELPLVGMLFRTVNRRRDQTELVVLVTASLVKPLDADNVPPLPGEDIPVDPGDLRLFLFGTVENEEPLRSAPALPPPSASPPAELPSQQPPPAPAGAPAGVIGFAR